MLFQKLCPDCSAESIYSFDFDEAAKKGIRGLILDIDNTLVPHDAPADEHCIRFLDSLKKKGFSLMILSNNHAERAGNFAKAVGVPFLCDAGKPSPGGYEEAVKQLGLKKEEILCVGDQLLTDIWGASNAGLQSLLVEPLAPETDTAWIKVKRVLEKPIKCLHNKTNASKMSQD